MTTPYTVQAGDTLVRIAHQFGFPDWRTIYDAPDNAAFRQARPDPDKIFPGDQLVIPDRDPPVAGGFPTGQLHRFRLSTVVALPTATLTVHVVDDGGRPIDGADVTLSDADGAPRGAASSAAGSAVFASLPPGSYTIAARKLGYRGDQTDVEVVATDEATLTLDLQWRADWDRAAGLATMGSVRSMVLTAPDLPAGSPVTFTVSQLGTGTIGTREVTSEAGRAAAPWDDWFAVERVMRMVQLAAGEPFPVVELGFVAEAAGVKVTADGVLGYADRLDARIDAAHLVTPGQPADYILYSPYGTRTGKTDANGALVETELPPGGVSVVFVQQVLVPS